jgi:hypothetical protein
MKNISKAFNSNQEKEEDRKIPAAAGHARNVDNETQSQEGVRIDIGIQSQKINIAKAAGLNPGAQAVRKVVRMAARLADLCTEQDLEDDARVIREATKATHRSFNLETKTMDEIPDHKTRLAATTLRRAYVEGLPDRKVSVVVNDAETAAEVVDRIRNSPEMLAALRTMAAHGLGQVQVGDGEIIDVEATILKTGGENPGVAYLENAEENHDK